MHAVRSLLVVLAIAPVMCGRLVASDSSTLTLPDGTQVVARIGSTVSSESAHNGDKVTFITAQNVVIDGRVVIAAKSPVTATIVRSEGRGARHLDGKLVLNVESVMLRDGESVPLRVAQTGSASDPKASEVVATLGMPSNDSIISQRSFGKDVEILEGTEFRFYISGDTSLASARFDSQPAAPAATSSLTRLDVVSSPPEAEVDVDGKYISDTPAAIGLSAGQHKVTVRRAGYEPWSEFIVAEGSNIKKSVTLYQTGSTGLTFANCGTDMSCADSPGDAARTLKQKKSEESSH